MFARPFVTLNFEGSFVRLLTARGNAVEWWMTEEFPPDVMSHGVIYDSRAVGERLGELFSEHRLPRNRVLTSVTGQRSLSRVLTLPVIKDRYLEGAIRRKAKQGCVRSLGHAAAVIRLTAKRSIRKRKRASPAGQPPHTHTKRLPSAILYCVTRPARRP